MVRKVGIGLGVAAALVGYLYFKVVMPGAADVRYCQQFLSVMHETNGLLIAPTSIQVEQLEDSVNGLAGLSGGSPIFPGAEAAATMMRDINELGSSPSPNDVLRISRDADSLESACRADVA